MGGGRPSARPCPPSLAYRFGEAGHDVLHALDLPAGNRTSDDEITTLSERDDRVVVTKDADFVNSFLISGTPRKLLLVSVGNASNAELEVMIVPRLPDLAPTLSTADYVGLTRTAIIVHA